MHITEHAITRWCERVDPSASYCAALTALQSPAIRRAVEIGAPYVRLGTGHRVVIEDGAIVTVLPRGTWRGCLDRRRKA